MSALAVRADVCANDGILPLFAEAVEKLGWQVSPGFARFIFARHGCCLYGSTRRQDRILGSSAGPFV
jgi:hypothetical protein